MSRAKEGEENLIADNQERAPVFTPSWEEDDEVYALDDSAVLAEMPSHPTAIIRQNAYINEDSPQTFDWFEHLGFPEIEPPTDNNTEYNSFTSSILGELGIIDELALEEFEFDADQDYTEFLGATTYESFDSSTDY